MSAFPSQQWIGLSAIVISVVWMGWLACHHFGKDSKKMIPLTGVVLCIAGAFAFGVWYFWPKIGAHNSLPSNTNEEVAKETLAHNSIVSSTAFFDCVTGSWADAETSKDAFSIAVTQFGQLKPSVGIASGPVAPHNHSQPYSSQAPLKCQMTFYGKTPLFNVRVPIIIEILSVVQTDINRRQVGNLLSELETTFSVKQVVIPDQHVVTFYVYGFDVNAAIHMRAPTEYSFETEDGGEFKGKVIESKVVSITTTFPNQPSPNKP